LSLSFVQLRIAIPHWPGCWRSSYVVVAAGWDKRAAAVITKFQNKEAK